MKALGFNWLKVHPFQAFGLVSNVDLHLYIMPCEMVVIVHGFPSKVRAVPG